MPLTNIKKLSIALLVLSLSSCSTTKPAHLACDFVGGSVENAIKRHENKNDSDIHGNLIKKRDNPDILEGVLSVIGGVLTRAFNSNNNNKCT